MSEIEVQYIPVGVSGNETISRCDFSDTDLSSIQNIKFIETKAFKPKSYSYFCRCCNYDMEKVEVDTFTDETCVHCSYFAEKLPIETITKSILPLPTADMDDIDMFLKEREESLKKRAADSLVREAKRVANHSNTSRNKRIAQIDDMVRAFKNNSWHISSTAREMGISHRTLTLRIQAIRRDEKEMGVSLFVMKEKSKRVFSIYFKEELIGTLSGVDNMYKKMLQYDESVNKESLPSAYKRGKYKQFRFEEIK